MRSVNEERHRVSVEHVGDKIISDSRCFFPIHEKNYRKRPTSHRVISIKSQNYNGPPPNNILSFKKLKI